MEEKINALIEENKQLIKRNQKLKSALQQKNKKIKQPEMLFGSIDDEFGEDKLA
jgi:regulator of replication initiation timing